MKREKSCDCNRSQILHNALETAVCGMLHLACTSFVAFRSFIVNWLYCYYYFFFSDTFQQYEKNHYNCTVKCLGTLILYINFNSEF
uniref:Uncharacterized protein n=1 Tax=Erpetoichthys calabaricus TaxID=27687 RepID=A0A8C4S2M1_ERPCA